MAQVPKIMDDGMQKLWDVRRKIGYTNTITVADSILATIRQSWQWSCPSLRALSTSGS